MTDLITRARKEWCEPWFGPGFPSSIVLADAYYKSCPPEVVAALLDVMGEVMLADSCPSCFGHRVYKHRPGCIVTAAEAAIAKGLKALEGV